MKKLLVIIIGACLGSWGTFWFADAISVPPIPPNPYKEERVKLLFVGDIMPSRYVAKAMRENGYDFPFKNTEALISGADLAFANLESPIIDGPIVPAGAMRFRSDPAFIPHLKKAGFDVVTLANNHAYDYGEKGIRSTISILSQASIAYAGAGTTSSAAYAPTYINAKGLRFAYIGQNDRSPVPAYSCASATKPGTACFDLEELHSAITEAKKHADFVIFTMHAGTEYVPDANQLQITYAHAAIDAGADIVIGHHPHVIEQRELYHDKWIYYSLGNFIFDQEWSRETKLGLALSVYVGKHSHNVVGFEHTIVRVDNFAQPQIASVAERDDRYEVLGLP